MKKVFIIFGILIITAFMVSTQEINSEALRLTQRLQRLKLNGLIPLRFGNAVDGSGISGATITIENIGSFTSDIDGIISFPEIPDGFYTLTFTKEGFITTTLGFEVVLSTVIANRFSISPVMSGNSYRIVLEWGETPRDLDLHLEKDREYHISWRNMRSNADGSVVLDRDATNGFGPETITITRTEAQGVYNIYVIDYTNYRNERSRALSNSGATVRVYHIDRLLNTFTIPRNITGNRWNVFRIIQGNVSPVNTVTYSR